MRKIDEIRGISIMEQTIRVFIADASRDSVELLRRLLEEEGSFSVVGTAYRGDEALRRFPESGADLLLCDLLLPGLDGLSLLRSLRAENALPHAIVLSGFYNDKIARSLSGLVDDFLPKPCSAQSLLRRVRDCALGLDRCIFLSRRAAVRRALQEANVMPHLDGFRYLESALDRTWGNPALLRGVTKSLYRDVAKEFDTNPACVERSIRAAVDRSWERMSDAARRRIFGSQSLRWTKAPSNVPFLTALTAFLENGEDLRHLNDSF